MSTCDICDELANDPDYTPTLSVALREIIKLLCNTAQAASPAITSQTSVIPTPGYSGPVTDSPYPVSRIRVYNGTDVPIFVSVDGVTDLGSVGPNASQSFIVGAEKQVFIRSNTAATGDVFVWGYL